MIIWNNLIKCKLKKGKIQEQENIVLMKYLTETYLTYIKSINLSITAIIFHNSNNILKCKRQEKLIIIVTIMQ